MALFATAKCRGIVKIVCTHAVPAATQSWTCLYLHARFVAATQNTSLHQMLHMMTFVHARGPGLAEAPAAPRRRQYHHADRRGIEHNKVSFTVDTADPRHLHSRSPCMVSAYVTYTWKYAEQNALKSRWPQCPGNSKPCCPAREASVSASPSLQLQAMTLDAIGEALILRSISRDVCGNRLQLQTAQGLNRSPFTLERTRYTKRELGAPPRLTVRVAFFRTAVPDARKRSHRTIHLFA